jgi:tetratricopeptide (TPR) repeat protein
VRFERVDERLRRATEIDPVDPEPWRMRAQLALREWKRTHDEKWFDLAISSQREVITRDPRHAHDYRALAEMFLDRFAIDHLPQDAEAAVDAAGQALALYPNQLSGRRTLALALDAAGKKDEAVQAARAAVELDALWLELAHYDKVLTAEERARMKELAGEGM